MPESRTYLKIIWYKRESGYQMIVGEEKFERIGKNRIPNGSCAVWRRCPGQSDENCFLGIPQYEIYQYVDKGCTGQRYYKIIYWTKEGKREVYYTKKDKKHEIRTILSERYRKRN